MAKAMGALGVRNCAAEIILYSRSPPLLGDQGAVVGMMGATRVWWQLVSWGFTAVRVLDGGWEAWRRAGLPSEVGPSTATAVAFDSDTLVDLAAQHVATEDDVRRAVQAGDSVIMDALTGWPNTAAPYGKHHGKARMGHILGAISLQCTSLLREDGTWLPPSELSANLKLHVDPGSSVVAY